MSTPSPTSGSSHDPTRSWLATPQPPPTSQTSPSSAQPNPSLPPIPSSAQTPTPQRRITISDAFNSIKPSDLLKVHQAPCSQQGFLTGIGTGATIGLLRWVLGLPIPRAANWAVGTGALGAMVQYEYCQHKRRQEREKMQRMVEVYNARQAREKAGAEEKAREAKEKQAREEAEQVRKGAWWKVW